MSAPAEWEDPDWVEKWYRIICERIREEQEKKLLRPINEVEPD